jgi:hypothetical protein
MVMGSTTSSYYYFAAEKVSPWITYVILIRSDGRGMGDDVVWGLGSSYSVRVSYQRCYYLIYI